MRRIIRSPLNWALFALLQLYWVGYWLIDSDDLNIFLLGVRFAMAAVVFVSYWGAAVDGLRAKYMTGVQQLVVGIEVTWFSVATLSAWSLMYRWWTGNSPAETSLTGFFLFVGLFGLALHITAPQTPSRGAMKFSSWYWVIGAILLGLLASSAVIWKWG